MTTTYTPLWRLAVMTQLDPAVKNAWGTITAASWSLVEQGGVGNTPISIAGLTTYTLTIANNSADQGRLNTYDFIGALTGDCTVTIPAISRVGYAVNNTTGNHNVILTTGGGTTLTVPPGLEMRWFCDGTNIVSPAAAYSSLAVIGTATAANGTSGSQIVNYSQFAFVSGTTGYYKLPNGYIRQWGTSATDASGSVNVTFPIAFPSACRGTSISQVHAYPAQPIFLACGIFNTTNAIFYAADVSSAPAPMTFVYEAWGF